MYAIDEGMQKINGEMVETFHREVLEGNTNLEVEAGTTGYKGGCCRNAGGRTYLSLLCLSGDFFSVRSKMTMETSPESPSPAAATKG